MGIKELLQLVIDRNASDLHLIVGVPPTLRVDGVLTPVPNEAVLTPELIGSYAKEVMNAHTLQKLTVNKEVDFSLSFSEKGRYRVNAYTQRGTYALAFRRIPIAIPTIDSLNLPKILHSFTTLKQGFRE